MKILLSMLAMLAMGASAVAEVSDAVVAIVNDDVITQAEIEAVSGALREQIIISAKKEDAAKMLDALKRDVLAKLIEDRLILHEAKRLEIRVREEEIGDMEREMSARFKTEEEFEDVLAEQGISLEKLRSNFRDQVMMRKLITREIRSKTIVTPTEITEYYESHKDEFVAPQMLKVRHILIRSQDNKTKEGARRKAQDVITLIKNGGDFAELAKRYSEGPNAEAGGDMGYIKRGQLLKDMDDAIFSMEVGQVSGAIYTELGYHIFKVEDKRKEKASTLEEARSKIEDMLYKKKAETRYNAWMDKLKRDAYILVK